MDTPHPQPTLRTKSGFWLLLAVLSVAIAEVTVASSPLAFINPLKGLFLVTFYGSHLLIFAWLTFRKGWPSLPTLWFAGVLFGLYEFYITKVLWSPPWGDAISLAHVDVISFVVLAFFWHPFMAFIFPLAIGESAGSATSWVRSQLPTWLTAPSRRRATWTLAVAVVSLATFFGSPVVVLLAALSAGLAVTVSLWWWRRDPQRVQWNLRDLLPNTKQAKGIGLLLAIQYLVFIPAWRRGDQRLSRRCLVMWWCGCSTPDSDSCWQQHCDAAVPTTPKPSHQHPQPGHGRLCFPWVPSWPSPRWDRSAPSLSASSPCGGCR